MWPTVAAGIPHARELNPFDGDLRFGERDRWQLHARSSYGFPVVWLIRGPHVAGLITAGVRIF